MSHTNPPPERIYVVLSGRDGHRFADCFGDRESAHAHFHHVCRFDPEAKVEVMVRRRKVKPKVSRLMADTVTTPTSIRPT